MNRANKHITIDCLLLVLTVLSIPLAYGLPEGMEVVFGDASEIQTNESELVIEQQSDKAILNFESFDIAESEQVEFQLPDTNSVSLARVMNGSTSEIFGSLRSNGNLFLLNPAGLLIGETSQLDLNGLVLSIHAMDNTDFLSGHYRFKEGVSPSEITQNGRINTQSFAVILAESIHNHGSIESNNLLLSNDRSLLLSLDNAEVAIEVTESALAGYIENSGTLSAGSIELSGGNAQGLYELAINNEGTIEATSIEAKDGRVFLTAASGRIENNGSINGTQIDIHSERISQLGSIDASQSGNGGDINFIASDSILIGSESYTAANAGTTGDGGNVIAFADNMALFRDGALIEAKGGTKKGNGGFVEVSGLEYIDIHGRVDTSATTGKAGLFLIDPHDVTITNADANGNFNGSDPNQYAPFADDATIDVNTILTNLATSDVIITTTSGGITQGGTLTVDTDIDLDGINNRMLRLQSDGNLVMNASILDSNTATEQNNRVEFISGAAITMGVATQVDVGTGEISMIASGAIQLSQLRTSNSGNTAINITSNSQITDNNGATTNIIANSGGLQITTSGSIGNLQTQVDQLSITTTGVGDVQITEVDDLTITQLNTVNGGIVVEVGGNLTAGNISATGGNLDLHTLNGTLSVVGNLSATDTADNGVREGEIQLSAVGGDLLIGTNGDTVQILSQNTVDNDVNGSLGGETSIQITIDDTGATNRSILIGDGNNSDVEITAEGGNLVIDSTASLGSATSDQRPLEIRSDASINAYNSVAGVNNGVVNANGVTLSEGTLTAQDSRTVTLTGSFVPVTPDPDPDPDPDPEPDPDPTPDPGPDTPDPGDDNSPEPVNVPDISELEEQLGDTLKEKPRDDKKGTETTLQLTELNDLTHSTNNNCQSAALDPRDDCGFNAYINQFMGSFLIDGQLPPKEVADDQ